MLISRVIWQKALRLNKNRIFLLFLFILLQYAAMQGLGAQQEAEARERVSILQRGPIFRKGLPFFLPNAIPGFSGVYRFRETEITVYYTETKILRRQEWLPFDCPGSTGLLVPEQEEGVLLVFPAVEDGWTIFFSYQEQRDDICRFIDTFLEQFLYFRGITRDREIPPFPAVLQLE